MDFHSFWNSSGSAAQNNLGDPIGNSLRFRATNGIGDDNIIIQKQDFVRSSSRTATLSWWAKHCNAYRWRSQWQSTDFWIFQSNGNDVIDAFYGCYSLGGNNGRKFRDSSAWFHYVVQVNGQQGPKIWINGEVQTITGGDVAGSTNFFNTDRNCYGSYYSQHGSTSWNPDSYLAEVIHVDSVAVPPTAFGRFNSMGVWVPKSYTVPTYTSLTTYSYRSFDGTGAPGNWASMTNRGDNIAIGTNTGVNTTHSSVAIYSPNAQRKTFYFSGSTSNIILWVWQSDDGVNWERLADTNFNQLPYGHTTEKQYACYQFSGGQQFTSPTYTVRNTGEMSFHLDFSDSSDLGKDKSGFGNDWSLTGPWVLSGTNTDWVTDSPTNNTSINNSSVYSNRTVTHEFGNLYASGGSNWTVFPNHAFPTKGKYYVEMTIENMASGYPVAGVMNVESDHSQGSYKFDDSCAIRPVVSNGNRPGLIINKVDDQNFVPELTNLQNGDVLQTFYDADANKVWFGINGTYCGFDGTNPVTVSLSDIQNGTNPVMSLDPNEIYTSFSTPYSGAPLSLNYGQQPRKFTPPAGYGALEVDSYSAPPIENPKDYVRAIRTGKSIVAGAGQRSGNYAPFLTVNTLWWARREAAFDGNVNNYFDVGSRSGITTTINFAPEPAIDITGKTVRVRVFTPGNGGSKMYIGDPTDSNSPVTDVTVSQDWVTVDTTGRTEIGPNTPFKWITNNLNIGTMGWSAFEVDGEVLVDGGPLSAGTEAFPEGIYWIKEITNDGQHQWLDSLRGLSEATTCPNKTTQAYVPPTSNENQVWVWGLDEDFTPTSTQGLSNLSGKRNVKGGVSVVRATGSNVQGSTYTHGLNKKPSFILAKSITNNYDWAVYHSFQGDTTNNTMYLSSSGGNSNRGAMTFTVDDVNVALGSFGELASNETYVYYNWQEIEGYSKFGIYKGNGSSYGRFVYLGFKPALLIVKTYQNSDNWMMFDSTTNLENPAKQFLYPNLTNTMGNSTNNGIDFLSNGFRLRGNDGNTNASRDYLYCAWAEMPMGGKGLAPATAR